MMTTKLINRVAPGKATRTIGRPLTPEELRIRHIARFELLGFANALNWPAVEWTDADGRACRIAAGEWSWRNFPIEAVAKRRLVYMALVAVEPNLAGNR
jgi:hypothetical protein